MAVMCFVVWRQYKSHRYLLWMAANQLFLVCALLGQTLLRTEHPYISTLWVTVLYFGSSVCLHRTMSLRLGQRPIAWPLLGIALIGVACMWHFLEQTPSIFGRITTVSLTMAAILLYGLPRLLKAPKRHKLDQLSLVLFILTGLTALLRPLLLYLTHEQDLIAEHSIVWWGTLLSILLLSIGLSTSLAGSALLDTQHLLRQERDHDSLTGLLNRRAFEEICTATPYARGIHTLIACDLDHFKRINDRYGHLAGDMVLRQFGQLLHTHVRQGDIVARTGGEEFLIALRLAQLRHASEWAQRFAHILQSQQWEHERLPTHFKVTASFGIIQVRKNESLYQALERVDDMLYTAKRAGRNRIHKENAPALTD